MLGDERSAGTEQQAAGAPSDVSGRAWSVRGESRSLLHAREALRLQHRRVGPLRSPARSPAGSQECPAAADGVRIVVLVRRGLYQDVGKGGTCRRSSETPTFLAASSKLRG